MNINKKCIIGLLGVVVASPIAMKSEKSEASIVGRLTTRLVSGLRGIFSTSTRSTSIQDRVTLERLKVGSQGRLDSLVVTGNGGPTTVGTLTKRLHHNDSILVAKGALVQGDISFNPKVISIEYSYDNGLKNPIDTLKSRKLVPKPAIKNLGTLV